MSSQTPFGPHIVEPVIAVPETPKLTLVLSDHSMLATEELDPANEHPVMILPDPAKTDSLLRRPWEGDASVVVGSEAFDQRVGLAPSHTRPKLVVVEAPWTPQQHDAGSAADPPVTRSDRRSQLTEWLIFTWPKIAFWSVVLFVVAYRYAVMVSGGAPATIDGGNWLAFGDGIFGGSSRDGSVVYPPVVPVLAQVSTWMFGTVSGIAVLGVLAALAPGFGLYHALGMAGIGSQRLFPAILLIAAGSVGEALAWGGFPQLIGLGLLPIGMMLGLRYLDNPTRLSALKLGGLIMLCLAVTHFLAVVLLLTLVLLGMSALVRRRSWSWVKALARTFALVALPSLALLPVYAKLIDAVILNPNEFAALDNLTVGNALSRLELVYSDFPAMWEMILPLAVVTPLLCWAMRRDPVWRLLVSLLVATSLMIALTQEGRYLYLAPLVGALGVAVWMSRLDELESWLQERSAPDYVRVAGVALLVLLALGQIRGGLALFPEHRDFYGVMTLDIVEAIDAAGDYAGDSGVVLVPSLGDAPIGWWVEALTDGEVLYGSPLRWLNFSDEVTRATVANAIFDPSFPDAETLAQLEEASVDVVIIPTRWAWFDQDEIGDWVNNEGLSLLLENDDALVITMPDP